MSFNSTTENGFMQPVITVLNVYLRLFTNPTDRLSMV